MMKYFLFLLLFIVACAPKEEDITSLAGSYRANPDTTNGAIACWLTTDVDGGTNSGSNIVDVLDIKTAQFHTLTFEGREFRIESTGDSTSCISTGTYTITSRSSADVGKLTFFTTSTTCTSSVTGTIHQLGNDTEAVSVILKPDSTYSSDVNFSISTSSQELYIEMPIDLNFSDPDHDDNCENGLCTCFFKFSFLSN